MAEAHSGTGQHSTHQRSTRVQEQCSAAHSAVEQSRATHHSNGGDHHNKRRKHRHQPNTRCLGWVLDPPRRQPTHAQPPLPTNKARTQGTTRGPQPHTHHNATTRQPQWEEGSNMRPPTPPLATHTGSGERASRRKKSTKLGGTHSEKQLGTGSPHTQQ